MGDMVPESRKAFSNLGSLLVPPVHLGVLADTPRALHCVRLPGYGNILISHVKTFDHGTRCPDRTNDHIKNIHDTRQ